MITSTIATNQNMIGLGAIPARWRWLFTLAPLGALLVALMIVVMVQLWSGGYRSRVGRAYFTLLTLAAVAGVLNLVQLGVMGLWR